jgi:ABC-2 type transport system ATP-binding protein
VRGAVEGLVQQLAGIAGVQRVRSLEGDGRRLEVETDRSQDLRPLIARTVVQSGADLMELKLVDLSLEDVFIQLVTEESQEEEAQP